MRSLVTGGTGFTGSHLVKRLLERGEDVVALDKEPGLFADQLRDAGAEIVLASVTDREALDDATRGVDVVYHLAALIAIPYSYHSPDTYVETNVKGTLNVLQAARDLGTEKIVHTSTSEVYGDPLTHPQSENYWGNVNPIGNRGVYDEAKRFAEALAMAYHRYHGVETRIMRIHDGRALPTFMRQALRGNPLTVYGDGSQTRSFMYVDDLVEGVWRLSQSDYVEPVNIGNPEEITILDFAKEIIELTGSESEITFEDLPKDDPQVRQPDITRAREVLDWEPQYDRREGVSKTFDYFKSKVLIDQKEPS